MIPKKIHYVWLGGGEKPELVRKCIESWKRFCPDYEIREWGDRELLECGNRYALDAYRNRKLAFASDYLRLKALYEYGGFYFDTDLEVLKPLDLFLGDTLTMCSDLWGEVIGLTTAFIGSEAKSPAIGGFMQLYDGFRFFRDDGEMNVTPNNSLMRDYLEREYGMKLESTDETIDLGSGMKIYPRNYFCNSKQGWAYHHYAGSWVPAWRRNLVARAGQYKLLFFKWKKNRKNADKVKAPALQANERKLAAIKLGERKVYMLVKMAESQA